MNRSFIISAIAFAAFVMTGCMPEAGGTSKMTVDRVTKSTRNTIGGPTVVKEYSWSPENASQVGEVEKIDGLTSYSISDYEWSVTDDGIDILSRIRTRNVGMANIREKLVTTYGAHPYDRPLESKYEEFLLGPDGSETVPVRYSTTSYSGHGLISEVKYFEGDQLILHQWDFDYFADDSGHSYSEREEGGDEVRKAFKWTSDNQSSYERYIIGPEDQKFVYEKATDYEANLTTRIVEFTITEYDPTGENPEPVVTEVEEQHVLMDVTIKF